MAQVAVCPADAVTDAKAQSDVVLKANGGCGVLCELYDVLRSKTLG